MVRRGGVLRLDGVSQLKEGLRLFAQEVNGGNVSHDVMTTIAEDTLRDMQENCPKDTWYLHDHISIEEVSAVGIYITSAAPYTGYVEFGTKFMEAQPFYMPAIDDNFKRAFPTMYLNALSDEWSFICRKFGRRGFGAIKAV